MRFRERGVLGVSLGGSEHRFPPELFARPFALAREGGLKAAPHAGEVAGPASVRAALDVLHADRLRHGVRAVEDPALLAEIAARGIVCDVTPTSNVLARRRRRRWPSTPCRACWRRGSAARSPPTTRS